MSDEAGGDQDAQAQQGGRWLGAVRSWVGSAPPQEGEASAASVSPALSADEIRRRRLERMEGTKTEQVKKQASRGWFCFTSISRDVVCDTRRSAEDLRGRSVSLVLCWQSIRKLCGSPSSRVSGKCSSVCEGAATGGVYILRLTRQDTHTLLRCRGHLADIGLRRSRDLSLPRPPSSLSRRSAWTIQTSLGHQYVVYLVPDSHQQPYPRTQYVRLSSVHAPFLVA